MGGYGSGRTTARAAVDGSIALDINSLVRKRILIRDARSFGTLRWTRVSDGKETASCGYGFDTTCNPMMMNVFYTYNRAEKISCNIVLDSIPVYFGGRRLYLICPECGRRTWHLYLRRFVKCRICHNLTYQSCKESHGSDLFYARMASSMGVNMENLRRAMSFYIKQGRKERERKARLSRRGRKRKTDLGYNRATGKVNASKNQ